MQRPVTLSVLAPALQPMRRQHLGFACNNACSFCAQGRLRETSPAIAAPLDEVIAGEIVAFVGGEPTLDADLPGRVASCVAQGAARIVVQTNGRRLSSLVYAEALAAAGAGKLFLDVALQGSTRAMHEHHTSVPGSFAQTIQGLRHAHGAHVPCGVSVVLTRSNYRHLVEIVRVAHAVGALAVRPVIVSPLGAALVNAPRLSPPPALLSSHVQAAVREAARLGIVFVRGGLGGLLPGDEDARFPFAGLGLFAGPAAPGDETTPPAPAVAPE